MAPSARGSHRRGRKVVVRGGPKSTAGQGDWSCGYTLIQCVRTCSRTGWPSLVEVSLVDDNAGMWQSTQRPANAWPCAGKSPQLCMVWHVRHRADSATTSRCWPGTLWDVGQVICEGRKHG